MLPDRLFYPGKLSRLSFTRLDEIYIT